jgi:hypothetical protein
LWRGGRPRPLHRRDQEKRCYHHGSSPCRSAIR